MSFEDLQHAIGIRFTDRKLLELAFVHRSYLNEDRSVKTSNERMEFLGDAVLSFLTSEFLYRTYPDYPEGTLTNVRSSMVKTSTLAAHATKLGLGNLLYLSKGEIESGGRKNPSLLADAFEAFLGALFLDQGIDRCRTFLEQDLFPDAKTLIENKAYIDFKSRLQELVQETSKNSPDYTVTKSEGPDHDKTFYVTVSSDGTELGSGSGRSKQLAEQSAARNALEKIDGK